MAKKITVSKVSEILLTLGFSERAFDVKDVKAEASASFMKPGFSAYAESYGSTTKLYIRVTSPEERKALAKALYAAGVKFDESDKDYYSANKNVIQFSVSPFKAYGWNA